MNEQPSERPPFRMETDIIPAGVDTTLAKQRTALINAFRSGELDAAAAYRELEHLYWKNQQTADNATSKYLRETTYSFPVEANLSMEEATKIYHEVQEEY